MIPAITPQIASEAPPEYLCGRHVRLSLTLNVSVKMTIKLLNHHQRRDAACSFAHSEAE